MSYLQNTNDDIYQQLLNMNKSKGGGGGGGGFKDENKSGAMNKQIDECSSFEKGTPEYTACQERLKEMQYRQKRINDSVPGGEATQYDPKDVLYHLNPNDHRGYKIVNGKVVPQNPL